MYMSWKGYHSYNLLQHRSILDDSTRHSWLNEQQCSSENNTSAFSALLFFVMMENEDGVESNLRKWNLLF